MFDLPYFKLGNSSHYYYESLPDNNTFDCTIIFVHGAGGHGGEWINQLRELGKFCRVLAPDLPGHGKSGGTVCNCIEDYREYISQFANKMGKGPYYLAGHSMGGAIVLDYSLQYPKNLIGVILLSTSARFKVINAMLHMVKNVWLNNELVKNDFSVCEDFDVTGVLSKIQLPVLVAVGAEDVITPLKYSRRLSEGLNDARLVEITNAGHMVMLDEPDIVNRVIIEFINERRMFNHETNYSK
ncbi:MAG: alpha/beta hydrolase [Peptococcaceae bacterium]|nr:alpha/beta hydrolase [Peptococcaceae bacterium]